MSNLVFCVSLVCTNCGALNDERSNRLFTPGIGHSAGHTFADPGDVLDLVMMDFEDGYFTLHRPDAGATRVTALELWGCKTCGRTQAARIRYEYIDFRHWRFIDATATPLSDAMLDEAQFISRQLEEWAPNAGDAIERVNRIRSQNEQGL